MDPLNSEFARVLSKSGWSQAEAARQLHLSRSAISLYLSGQARPSLPVLQLLKLMVGDDAPVPGLKGTSEEGTAKAREGSLLPLADEEAALIRDLRALGEPLRRRALENMRGWLALIAPVEAARRQSRH